MRTVIVMFDSLNLHFLEPYGCDWTHTPNFKRLASRTATFDNSHVCSMPCMPARRDFHTGRPNFLHRSWSPLEPFDDSVPEMLKNAGIHTHLATDHQHYWEDGGATYHSRYSTYDLIRGQEGDAWVGQVKDPEWPDREIPRTDTMGRQDILNRERTSDPAHFPLNLTFQHGMDFIRRNHQSDPWLLQIEAFDPHEPFFSLDEFRKPYQEHFDQYQGKSLEWPPYREVRESREAVDHARHEYAALLSGCDARLGNILDLLDELNLWKDTMLIVWTDHGFLMGEHDSWAKCWLPFYNEISHTPFFIWDPRHPECAGQRRQALVQPSIDLGPTLLNFFGLKPTPDMTGHDLESVITGDSKVRDHALFGIFGGQVNLTDGRYVYMRGPTTGDNLPLFNYTLMPTHMRSRFSPEELCKDVTLAPPFPFTKNCPTLKIPAYTILPEGLTVQEKFPTRLYDLSSDPGQEHPLHQPELEQKLAAILRIELQRVSAPEEQLIRLGL